MKRQTYFTLFLLLFLSCSCSKDASDLDSKEVETQYLGPVVHTGTTPESTDFIFSLHAKASLTLVAQVEAVTLEGEKLVSPSFVLTPGETKEIAIKKLGAIYDKDYIKSYRTHAVQKDFSPPPSRL